jgi:hypothetical protein
MLIVPVVLLACLVRSLFGILDRDDDRRRQAENFEKAPVEVIALASPAAQPAKLPLTYPAGELATAATWPRACDVLPDDDVRAFLPQADHFERRGEGRTVTFRTDEVQVPADVPYRKTVDIVTVDVPEYRCDVKFWLPHKTLPPHPTTPIATLTVMIEAAGDPPVVRAFAGGYLHEPADDQFAAAHGAAACRLLAENSVRCTKGALTLDVDGGYLAVYDGVDTCRLDGTQPGKENQRSAYFSKVVLPVMAYLLAKIP